MQFDGRFQCSNSPLQVVGPHVPAPIRPPLPHFLSLRSLLASALWLGSLRRPLCLTSCRRYIRCILSMLCSPRRCLCGLALALSCHPRFVTRPTATLPRWSRRMGWSIVRRRRRFPQENLSGFLLSSTIDKQIHLPSSYYFRALPHNCFVSSSSSLLPSGYDHWDLACLIYTTFVWSCDSKVVSKTLVEMT